MLQAAGLRRLLKSLHLKIFLTKTMMWRMIVTTGLQIPMMMLISDSINLPHSVQQMELWNLDRLAAFIKELEGLSIMTGPDLSDIIDNLLIPQQQEIKSMTVHNVVQV